MRIRLGGLGLQAVAREGLIRERRLVRPFALWTTNSNGLALPHLAVRRQVTGPHGSARPARTRRRPSPPTRSRPFPACDVSVTPRGTKRR